MKETMRIIKYKCPHCGWVFEPSHFREYADVVPTHDFPKPARSVCPGAGEVPRSIHDVRKLWKDEL